MPDAPKKPAKPTGSFFAPLWGIDDPEIERAIRREAFRRYSGLGHAALLVLGGSFLMAAANSAVFGGSGSNTMWITFFIFPIWDWLLGKWMLWRARKLLPEILHSMGRCINCGYKLESSENTSAVCPECGLLKQSSN